MSPRSYLKKIRSILKEHGVMINHDLMRDPKFRKQLHRVNGYAFLSVSSDGTPTFPIVNHNNALCYATIKKSLNAARRLYNQTGDIKYLDLIGRLEYYLNILNNKAILSHVPRALT